MCQIGGTLHATGDCEIVIEAQILWSFADPDGHVNLLGCRRIIYLTCYNRSSRLVKIAAHVPLPYKAGGVASRLCHRTQRCIRF